LNRDLNKTLQVLQGSIDKIVPPEQSKEIVRVIEEHGGVVKYVEYENEGHGWRQASTIKDSFEQEVAWYRKMFGL
jgi:dipeptidyl aminopeptidase/acylaminoacyl peptidase